MSLRVTYLSDDASGAALPCRDCVFWQDPRRSTHEARKARWAEGMRRESGHWGVLLWEGETLQGRLQYGPQERFSRALLLPAGPPTPGAALLTCVYLTADDPSGALERMLLEALADLQARHVAVVEAFATLVDGPGTLAHHTLLDRDVLERLGFGVVRTEGPVALMRLSIGGLERTPERLTERARRLLPRRPPTPRPT